MRPGDRFAATRFRPTDRAAARLAGSRFNRAQGDDEYVEVCTNCGAYYTPRPGQDYYDTRCGRCGAL